MLATRPVVRSRLEDPELHSTLVLRLPKFYELALPVIAADDGGPREIFGAEPRAGWLVEPRDPLALAAAMREALQLDTGGLREIGNRGRKRVEEAFSSTRFAAELASVFQRVCGAARARPAR